MTIEIRDDAFDLDALVLDDLPFGAYYGTIGVVVPRVPIVGGRRRPRIQIRGRARWQSAAAICQATGRIILSGRLAGHAQSPQILGQARLQVRGCVRGAATSAAMEIRGVMAGPEDWVIVIEADPDESFIVIAGS